LIYAYRSGDELHDDSCSRSNLLVLAAKDVDYLEDVWWELGLRELGIVPSSGRCAVAETSGQGWSSLVLVGLASLLAVSRRRRRPARTVLLGLGVLAVTLSFERVARACSCAYQTPEEAFADAGAVFIGRMVDQRYAEYEFEVLAAYKGVQPDTEVRVTAYQGGCGTSFEFREVYLIWAWRFEDGKLHDGMCSRSSPLALSSEELDYLGDRWWEQEFGTRRRWSRCAVDATSGRGEHLLVLVGLGSLLAANRRRRRQ
jgi:hypothetical protein